MIGRHRLQDGDEAVIGKHTLVFVDAQTEEPASSLPDLGGTVFLDTEAHRELLAQMSKGLRWRLRWRRGEPLPQRPRNQPC